MCRYQTYVKYLHTVLPCTYIRWKMMHCKQSILHQLIFLFTFLATSWGNETYQNSNSGEEKKECNNSNKKSYWGEVEKSKNDSSYMKKLLLLKLSCSVTYHQLDYYLAQEDCNKLSDFLLSWNDGMEIVLCIFG